MMLSHRPGSVHTNRVGFKKEWQPDWVVGRGEAGPAMKTPVISIGVKTLVLIL